MTTTMNKIKGHPGFMPMGYAPASSNKSMTQSEKEHNLSAKEQKEDAKKSN